MAVRRIQGALLPRRPSAFVFYAQASALPIPGWLIRANAIVDLEPLLTGRPALALTRHFPQMVGQIPAGTTPPDWLPRSGAPSRP